MKKNIIIFIGIVFILSFFTSDIIAQCPMCRMSAESNLANGGNMAKGLNKGILYLFALPYLLLGTIGYIWWRNNQKLKEY